MASDDEGSRRYIVVGLLWLLTAVYLGASGRVAAWRPPLPQIVLAGLTALVLVASSRWRGFAGGSAPSIFAGWWRSI
jgi:hypothetical protein